MRHSRGNKFDEAIAQYIRKKYNLMVGDRTAEEVKIRIASAYKLDKELTMNVRGRNLVTALPEEREINSATIREAIDRFGG